MAVVGYEPARSDGVDVFRRQRHANNHQLAFAAVEQSLDAIAWAEAVGQRHGLANQNFVRPSRGEAPAGPDVDVVEYRLAAFGQRN
jgi:hypothetical protein